MLYPNRLKTRPIVSSGYGWRIHPITGIRTFHYGVDSYGHPNGWNGAPEAGVVTFAGYNGGEGLSVHIQGKTRRWKLFHHARIDVAVGQQVGEGTVTGATGTTGASTGVHCHTECWNGSSSQDAFEYIAANLSGLAGGGVGGIITPRKKDNMTMVFWDGQNPTGGAARWALAGCSPGTTANWIETGDRDKAARWAAAAGVSIFDCGSNAEFVNYRGWFQQPVKTAGGGTIDVGDVKIDNAAVVQALQALGQLLAPKLDAVVAATNRLTPPG